MFLSKTYYNNSGFVLKEHPFPLILPKLQQEALKFNKKLSIKDKKLISILLYNLVLRKRYSGILLVPLSTNIWSKKTKKNKRLWKLINIGFTRHKLKKYLFILKKLNIIDIKTGIYYGENEDNKTTIIELNNIAYWTLSFTQEEYIKVFDEIYNIHHIYRTNNTKCLIRTKDNEEQILQNTTLDKINSGCFDHSFLKYKQVYNNSINEGGRFYSVFNGLPKAERKFLLKKINYSEIDFTSMIINTIHLAITGTLLNYDIYIKILTKLKIEFPSLTVKNDRKWIKKITLLFFNTENWFQYCEVAKTEIKNYLNNNSNDFLMKTNNYYSLFSKIKKIIIDIAPYLEPFIFKLNCFWTQNIESQVSATLMQKMIEKNYLPLSIHDAICVPNSEVKTIKKEKNKILKQKINELYNSFQFKQIELNDEFIKCKNFLEKEIKKNVFKYKDLTKEKLIDLLLSNEKTKLILKNFSNKIVKQNLTLTNKEIFSFSISVQFLIKKLFKSISFLILKTLNLKPTSTLKLFSHPIYTYLPFQYIINLFLFSSLFLYLLTIVKKLIKNTSPSLIILRFFVIKN